MVGCLKNTRLSGEHTFLHDSFPNLRIRKFSKLTSRNENFRVLEVQGKCLGDSNDLSFGLIAFFACLSRPFTFEVVYPPEKFLLAPLDYF